MSEASTVASSPVDAASTADEQEQLIEHHGTSSASPSPSAAPKNERFDLMELCSFYSLLKLCMCVFTVALCMAVTNFFAALASASSARAAITANAPFVIYDSNAAPAEAAAALSTNRCTRPARVNVTHDQYKTAFGPVHLAKIDRDNPARPWRHFVSFAGGSWKTDRIYNEALQLGLFDSVTMYSDVLPEWKTMRPEHFSKSGRGYGFWVWKPLLIERHLKEFACDGDIIVYADAGCTLKESYEWGNMFSEVSRRDLLGFQMQDPLEERMYTRRDVFNHFGISSDHPLFGVTHQIHGTFSVWRKTPGAIDFVEEWVATSAIYQLVSDEISVSGPENAAFRDARHDQSIFSLLLKTRVVRGIGNPAIMVDTAWPHREFDQAVFGSRRHD